MSAPVQKEMHIEVAELRSEVCGFNTGEKRKRDNSWIICDRVVYLQPGVDPNYLVGTCGKCGKIKAFKK